MSHDIRVHRPGESAVCTQCGKTVEDRWLEIPHHGETVSTSIEEYTIKVWCRECLLEACGIDPDTGDPLEDVGPCATCGGSGKIHEGHDKNCRCLHVEGPCPDCGGTGRGK